MRRTLAATIVVLAAITLGGCSFANQASSDESGVPQPVPGEQFSDGDRANGDVGADGGAPSSGGKGVTPGETDESSRDVISEGSITITVDDPIATADEVVKLVERAGGRIDSRQEQPPIDRALAEGSSGDGPPVDGPPAVRSSGAAQLVVRIPSEKLTAVLDDLKALGEVEQFSISATDVTGQTRDLDARITALRASVGRLTGLLSTADTTKDLIEIETALSQRQAELESLESQQRSLADLVDLATISISLGSVADAPIDEPDNFFTGLATGWEALVAFVGALLIALGVAMPWLILLGLAALAIIVAVRVASPRGRRPRATRQSPGDDVQKPDIPAE